MSHNISSFNLADVNDIDPFYFDENQLHYQGYNSIDDNPIKKSDRKRLIEAHQTALNPSKSSLKGNYALSVPSVSTHRVSNSGTIITPLRDHPFYKGTSSGKLFVSTGKQLSNNHFQQRSQESSPVVYLAQNRQLANPNPSHHDDTVSPFFASPQPEVQPTVDVPSNIGAPNFGGISLVSKNELPDRMRLLFDFPVFNAMQSKCFPAVYGSDDNLVVSAPTASGKTTIFELAICRLATMHDFTNMKIVYVAPTKALCEERREDWSSRFTQLGMFCCLLTGDTEGNQQELLKSSHIIVTTPEKWDSITRRLQDQDKLMQLVRLLLIDEIHILNEERGATVEAIVSRMKYSKKAPRIIALSATIPNANDVAAWLGKNQHYWRASAQLEVFGEEFRPSKLQKIVYPINCNDRANDFQVPRYCDAMLPDILSRHSIGKPILIFCPSRKDAEATAKNLSNYWSTTKQLWPRPRHQLSLESKAIQNLAATGVAYHHAGVSLDDRKVLEKAYLDNNLSVICSTSTLAMGVNLPCHLVVIKNTVTFTKVTGLKEYSDLEVMQMLGRAGRPQFGENGVGIILTKPGKVERYQRIVQGEELLESHLHESLVEHLNAEIALGTIRSIADARAWITRSFFYIRFQKNRDYYHINGITAGFSLDQVLETLCESNISLLRDNGIILPLQISVSKFGELMARHYIRLQTMLTFKGAASTQKMCEIINTVASAEEFHDVVLRHGENSLYHDLQKAHGIKYVVDNVNKDVKKRSLIIQAELGNVSHPTGEAHEKFGAQYNQDVATIFSNIHRLVRCFVDTRCVLEDGFSVRLGLELSRSLAARAWDNSSLVMKQLPQVGIATIRRFQQIGIKNIEDLKSTPVENLNRCSKINLFGTKILAAIARFPMLRITARILSQTQSNGFPIVHCQVELGFLNATIPKSWANRKVCLHLLIVRSDGYLIDLKHITDVENHARMAHRFSTKLEKYGQSIACYVSCDEIAGTLQEALIDPQIPANRFPLAPIRAAMSSERLSDQDCDDNLMDEDLLEAVARDYSTKENRPIHVPKSAANFDVSSRTQKNTLASTPLTAISSNIPRQHPTETPTLPIKLNNGKYACNHNCKNKTRCKHGECCREGLEKPPPQRKKDSLSDRSAKLPNKGVRDLSFNHRASLLPGKVTHAGTGKEQKPLASVTAPNPGAVSSLATRHQTIHQSVPASTLAKPVPATFDGLSLIQKRETPRSFDDDDFDGGWIDDDELEELINPNTSISAHPVPVDKPVKVSSAVGIVYKKQAKPFLDFSSDTELGDSEIANLDEHHMISTSNKRKHDFDQPRRSRSRRLNSDTAGNGMNNISSMLSRGQNRYDKTAQTSKNHDPIINESITMEEQIIRASQELADYNPFQDMEKEELDFMAQFEGCCEFVE